MAGRKGFSLIEILVVLIILMLTFAIALPNLFVFIGQTNAQAAKNNLLAIFAGQQRYFEDNGGYCTTSCGDNKAALSSNLRLGLSANDRFNYSCRSVGANIPYNCTAIYGAVTLTLNPNAQPPVTCTGPNSLCPS